MTEEQLYAEAMAQFGITSQMMVWNEETAELEAIIQGFTENPSDIVGEIADAIIMTRQMIIFYNGNCSGKVETSKPLLQIINDCRQGFSHVRRGRTDVQSLIWQLSRLHFVLTKDIAGKNDLQEKINQKLHRLAEMLGTRYEPTANNE